jgi:hypothetical protein
VQRSANDQQTEAEELLAQAIRICWQNDQTLGHSLAEILRFPIPKSSMISVGPPETLDEALRMLAYVGAECGLQESPCRERIDACVREVTAALATTLLRVAVQRMSS